MITTAIQRALSCLFLILFLTCSFAASTKKSPVRVAGKWQLSWEARLGTEKGTLQLNQTKSNLTGQYQGHITSSNISGTIDGNKISLNVDFQRTHAFTLIFTGTIDGDKMAGKFEIKDLPNGYDSHGESAHPSNYTWSAVRLPDQTSQSQSAPSAKLRN
jgi:hypothetical protein